MVKFLKHLGDVVPFLPYKLRTSFAKLCCDFTLVLGLVVQGIDRCTHPKKDIYCWSCQFKTPLASKNKWSVQTFNREDGDFSVGLKGSRWPDHSSWGVRLSMDPIPCFRFPFLPSQSPDFLGNRLPDLRTQLFLEPAFLCILNLILSFFFFFFFFFSPEWDESLHTVPTHSGFQSLSLMVD